MNCDMLLRRREMTNYDIDVIYVSYLKFKSAQSNITLDIDANKVYGFHCKEQLSDNQQGVSSGSSKFQMWAGGNTLRGVYVNGTRFATYPTVGYSNIEFWTVDNSSICVEAGKLGNYTAPISNVANDFISLNRNSTTGILYFLILYNENGDKIFDGWPVRIGSTPYFYNKINRTFYAADNHYPIELGPDVTSVGGGVIP